MSQALSETIRTIRVGITGTSSSESYTLAPGLAQYVESVYIEVTNNAASAVHPVLSISEQAGVVIAKRRQGGTISASGSGSATWALRLSGDDTGDTGLTGIFYTIANVGDFLRIETNGGSGADPIEVDYILDNGQFHITARDATRGEILGFTRFVHFLTTNADLSMFENGNINVTCGNAGTFNVIAGDVSIQSTSTDVVTSSNRHIFFTPGAGRTFTVTDQFGNPKIRWTEGTTDLHLPTGGAIIFDL